jgi:pimeloyl-ACP methyl ester carboxylesterase
MKLIFIHGSGGCKESWHYQTRYFTNSEAIDLPGHPEGEPCATIEDYVEWLHARLKKDGDTDLVIIGHSLGGGIALQYGLTYPEDLKGLICVGSGGRLRVHPMFLEGLEKAIDDSETDLALFEDNYKLIDPTLAETLTRRTEENGLPAMLNDLRACDKFDVMERLGEIDLPLLAVCGTDDMMTPPKYSQFMVDNMKNARIVIVNGGTHFAFAEKPDEVNQAIEEFLKEI